MLSFYLSSLSAIESVEGANFLLSIEQVRSKLKELEETYHADYLPSGATELINSLQDKLVTDMARIKLKAQTALNIASSSPSFYSKSDFAEFAGLPYNSFSSFLIFHLPHKIFYTQRLLVFTMVSFQVHIYQDYFFHWYFSLLVDFSIHFQHRYHAR